MLRELIDSAALRAARAALGGLTRRQEAISANIANIDTPGYQRRAVSFEQQLEASLQQGQPGEPRVTLARTDPRHLGSAAGGRATLEQPTPRELISERNDGNQVSVDEEMVLLAETQIRYQALTQTIGRRLATLRNVIHG